MEGRRFNQMMQIPTYQPYVGDPVPFQPLSPFFTPGCTFPPAYETENVSFGSFSPPIDDDRSFLDAFSSLNLSPATYAEPPSFCRKNLGGEIGDFVNAGEGFDLGVSDYLRRRRWSELEALRRHCSSGFDFDQKNLNSMKKFDDMIPNCSSLNLGSTIAENKFKIQRLDDYEEFNPCSNDNCRVGLIKSQSQSQNQSYETMSPWCLKKLRGRIYKLAKDQNGCRLLQSLFERPTFEEVEMVLTEVVHYISDLMKDQFGNYLVQKLVVVCNDDQKMQLILSLSKDIILVCMNPHGTRAVQKLLENLQDLNQIKLVMKALHHGAATLAVDPNGHHVIQHCLVNFHTDINMPILTQIADECYKIATDRSGCCVMQACVEHARGEIRTRIIAEIMAVSVHLAEDPYGNYVLQHMVGLNIPELTALLVRQLQGNFASLACNKYGSNVVEKCLNESGELISTRIILELIRSPNSSLLLVDPYANFVIQSALKVSKGFAHECLCGLISKNMWSMQTNLYGKKILGRFNKKKVNFA